ncbi:AAA family ATPase [Dactylosporangium vinaceum]|uniref:BTAD domain-containing putative transcriptional regulator n=1 Tax=Dactylosporangium vinaceum TaxID=53362 RepID=A0ABV5M0D9_9ACTN|nr:BTAD domain-containing putative transcriptional regulator [Dactylosporangium vinaceum]UAB97396.1 AAA family ATPase [Dactylosporangium vinaceum]
MIRVLGKFEIAPLDGAQPPPLTPKAQQVLAMLVMRANRLVLNTDLAKLWPSARSVETQIHKYTGTVRALIKDLDLGDVVNHHGQGYELKVAAQLVDLLVFERHVLTADAAAKQRDHDTERTELAAAVRLWSGTRLFGGVADHVIEILGDAPERSRRRALIRLADLELARGNGDEVLEQLRAEFDADPTDGQLCRLLMIVLFRTEHPPPEPLKVFDRHKEVLNEQLGRTPDTQLIKLRYAVASGDGAAVDEVYGARASSAAVIGPPKQLPPKPADFVGRERETDQIRWLLTPPASDAPPVVVIPGPPGIGKTTLAQKVGHAVARQFPDGQIYLELGGTSARPLPAAEAMALVLHALHTPKIPDGYKQRLDLFRTTMAERRVLLVLDDAGDELQVSDLIPGGPGSAVLITSRSRLPGVAGAHHIAELQRLSVADAVRQFQLILRRCEPSAPAELDAEQRIAGLCDGLPLAVYLAAMLRCGLPGRSTTDLADQIAAQPIGTLAWQGKSVARCIGAGLERHGPEAVRLFLGLGLTAIEEFGRWSAEAILGTEVDHDAALDQLVRAGLLRVVTPGRFRFDALTRDYARQRAQEELDDATCRNILERVYGVLAACARHANRGIYGGDFEVIHPDRLLPQVSSRTRGAVEVAPMVWFAAERSNLTAAIAHTAAIGMSELCWDLSLTAHEYHNVTGHLADWVPTHVTALDAAVAAGDRRGEAAMLMILGQPSVLDTRSPAVTDVTAMRRAVAYFRQEHDPHGLAIALRTLGNHLRRGGRFDAAIEAFTESSQYFEQVGDAVGQWQSRRYIGQCHLDRGDLEQAMQYLTDAADRARALGEARLRAQSAYWLGRAQLARGLRQRANEHFQYVKATVGVDPIGSARALHGLGDIAALDGEPAAARQYFTTALTMAHNHGGDAVLEGRIHLSLADLVSQPRERAEHLQRAVDCFDAGHAGYLCDQAKAKLRS